jgi:hypothetical protein
VLKKEYIRDGKNKIVGSDNRAEPELGTSRLG